MHSSHLSSRMPKSKPPAHCAPPSQTPHQSRTHQPQPKGKSRISLNSTKSKTPDNYTVHNAAAARNVSTYRLSPSILGMFHTRSFSC
ncbi:hypothetical protein T440DRAFT_34735 [Plenodomus tracheiphilus IPT5]|uniref:Uncharacterized protein n=1 Tax=Plenodomus tracheiphilus IPT5 TaxID=1408161 RepID=A0A6A7BE31_9PLEO|nr:hypothetical protein T440DRAFT_34735 [Plenodomus tracheiphilus IPT5]